MTKWYVCGLGLSAWTLIMLYRVHTKLPVFARMTKQTVNVIQCRLVLVVDRALGAGPFSPTFQSSPISDRRGGATTNVPQPPLFIALTNKTASEVLYMLCEPFALSSPFSRLMLSFNSYHDWYSLSIRNL